MAGGLKREIFSFTRIAIYLASKCGKPEGASGYRRNLLYPKEIGKADSYDAQLRDIRSAVSLCQSATEPEAWKCLVEYYFRKQYRLSDKWIKKLKRANQLEIIRQLGERLIQEWEEEEYASIDSAKVIETGTGWITLVTEMGDEVAIERLNQLENDTEDEILLDQKTCR